MIDSPLSLKEFFTHKTNYDYKQNPFCCQLVALQGAPVSRPAKKIQQNGK
jgi:hypothetical protein